MEMLRSPSVVVTDEMLKFLTLELVVVDGVSIEWYISNVVIVVVGAKIFIDKLEFNCQLLIIIRESLTTPIEHHLTNCKLKRAAKNIHQYFVCIEGDINADIPVIMTCWLSTWWD